MKKKTILLLAITIFSIFNLFSQSNFRGQRKSYSNKELTVEDYNINDSEDGIRIAIIFSKPVNPRTVNSSTIKINGRPLSSNVKINFNREATQARFILDKDFPLRSIELNGIKSFDGDSTIFDEGCLVD